MYIEIKIFFKIKILCSFIKSPKKTKSKRTEIKISWTRIIMSRNMMSMMMITTTEQCRADGSTRFCMDYRRLNALTTKDAYPLPRIDDSLRLLGNQQWSSTMDLASGYWQVAMSPEAKRKAAFVTNEGLFQFRVMPFYLCNTPATFERLMDRVLCGMRWSHGLVYLDDVISFGRSIPEALAIIVLSRLSNFGLLLKAK